MTKKLTLLFLSLMLAIPSFTSAAISDYQLNYSDRLLLNEDVAEVQQLIINDRIYSLTSVGSIYQGLSELHLNVFDKEFNLINSSKVNNNNVHLGFDLTYNEAKDVLAVVWNELKSNDWVTSYDVYLNYYDLDGNEILNPIKLNEDNLILDDLQVDKHDYPHIAFDDEGQGLVIWQAADLYNWNKCIYGQKIDANYQKKWKNFPLEESCQNDQIGSHYRTSLAYSNGNFLLIRKHHTDLWGHLVNKNFIVENGRLSEYNEFILENNVHTSHSNYVFSYNNYFYLFYHDLSANNGQGDQTFAYKKISLDGQILGDPNYFGPFLSNVRTWDVKMLNNKAYLTVSGHDNPSGSDDSEWKTYLVSIDLDNGSIEQELVPQAYNQIKASLIVDQDDIFITSRHDNLYLTNYRNSFLPVLPVCTDLDWSFSLEPAECQASEVQTKIWTKNNNCSGGITHPASEEISCVYTEQEFDDEDDSEEQIGNQDLEVESEIIINNFSMYSRLKGKIILKVEDFGKAYYMHPYKNSMYYLGRPNDAFKIMREQGIGITNDDLAKIPIGLIDLDDVDTDNDGLPDILEDAIGTDKQLSDTDGDGYNDKAELENNYSATNPTQKMLYDNYFADSHKGKIFIQVEQNGEAWYVNPDNGKRYFMGRPRHAFNIMRNFGLGISNSDFESL